MTNIDSEQLKAVANALQELPGIKAVLIVVVADDIQHITINGIPRSAVPEYLRELANKFEAEVDATLDTASSLPPLDPEPLEDNSPEGYYQEQEGA